MKVGPSFDVDAFLAAFDRLDAALVKAGWHPTSKWWRMEIERFFRSGRRRWVIRAGRRAGKSSTLCRLAVCWALAGAWHVPMGDTAVIPFVSLDRDEAAGRIRTIGEILSTLGVPHEPTADEIYLPSKRLRFSVKTCSVRAVGFTSVAIFADEMARWTSRDDSANPAREVMGSLRPTAATQPFAFEVCSSSPWSVVDYHAELFAQGDTDHQLTSFGATWQCNPTISEADTHGFEPDDRVWAREYFAIPSAELSSAFDPAHVDASFGAEPFGNWAQQVAVIDPNSGGADRFTLGFLAWATPVVELPLDVEQGITRTYDPSLDAFIETHRYYRTIPGRVGQDCHIVRDGKLVHFVDPGVPTREEPFEFEQPRPMLCLLSAEEIPSMFGRGDEIVAHIARECFRRGVRTVIGDQRESLFLETAFRAEKLRYHSLAWTSQNKAEAVRRLRRLMADQQLYLSPNETLRKELHNYSERLTASGTARYSARGAGHDDFCSLLITGMIADLERLLPGSPVGRPPNYRYLAPER